MTFWYVFVIVIMAFITAVARNPDSFVCDRCRMPKTKCICGFA